MPQQGRYLDSDRLSRVRSQYDQNFRTRSDTSPTEPLEYHLYHLALYWSRLMGFCGSHPSDAAHWVDSDLGACVAVGTDVVSGTLGSLHPHRAGWSSYLALIHVVLNQSQVSFKEVEAASNAFSRFLELLGFVSWESWMPTPSSPILSLPRR
jgi:hypothetical protein